jgi:hypothetical protein
LLAAIYIADEGYVEVTGIRRSMCGFETAVIWSSMCGIDSAVMRVVKEIVVEEVKRRMACKIAAEETEGTLMVEACCLMVKLDDNPVAKIGLNSR